MGTITPRKRANGTTGYTAQIRIKKGGRLVHQEAQTFDRKQAAAAWLKKRESVLAEPGAIERSKMPDPTLREVIERYLAESEKAIGRTKSQVLRTISGSDIGATPCSGLGSEAIVSYARSLTSLPQTRGNYISHLASIFAIARPAWGYPLDQQAMRDAQVVLRRLGVITKSGSRDRRPTLAELNMILAHYVERRKMRPAMNPMVAIVVFALFSTRRLEEITRITWADLDEKNCRVLVRDMKNPGEKIGNDVWCDLPPEALRIAVAQPRSKATIFPYGVDAISASFTRTTAFLGIEDLHFHDLRHDGISRLFELGATIPKAAAVSGHRSWQSLKRYAHLRHADDKYIGWPWIDRACEP